jgi:hypothetical protein
MNWGCISSEFGTSMVDMNPNGLSEGEIPLKPPGVPVMGVKPDKE